MSMRILVAAHHTWGVVCLRELMKGPHTIVGVITYPDSFDLQSGPYHEVWYESVKLCAQNYNLPTHQPADINSTACLELITDLAPDLIVNIAYGQIYQNNILSVPRLGIINLHGSLLPKYRGTTPIVSALMNGDTEAGVTLHFISERIDEGDIILQRSVMISEDDNANDVFAKTLHLYPALLTDGLQQLETGSYRRTSQPSEDASYYPKRDRSMEEINWHLPALQVYNFIRALAYPFRGAYTYHDGGRLIIWSVKRIDGPCHVGFPGQVISSGRAGVVVKASDTNLCLLEVQRDGQLRGLAKDVIGRRYVGTRLGLDLTKELLTVRRRIEAFEPGRSDRP